MKARTASEIEKGTRVKRPALTVEKKETKAKHQEGEAKTHKESLVHEGTFHKDSIVVVIDPGRCALVYAYRQDGRSFKLSGANFMPRAVLPLGTRGKAGWKNSFLTGLWDASLKAASFDKTSHTILAYGEIYHFCIGRCIIAENVHKWLLMCTAKVNSACQSFFPPLQMDYQQIKRNKLLLGMVKPNSQQLPGKNWLFPRQRSFTFAANHGQQSS